MPPQTDFMDPDLAKLTTSIQPVVRDTALWGAISLTIHTYLTHLMPPDHLITSIRGVVLRANEVLVVEEEGEHFHVVPGGRREKGESVLAALQREILEETGWNITNPAYHGFAHFHHQTPRPTGHKYPYPDFCQLYYVVQAEAFQPKKKLDDDILQKEYVLGTQWVPIDAAFHLPMDASQYVWLSAARARQ